MRLRPSQATVPALASRDFNGDGNVSFADFFIFASGFGSTDPNLDLDRDGRVGRADLSLLKESFGETAAQKLLFAQKVEVAEGSHMEVTAEAFSGKHVVVQLRLKGVPQLLGYGLGVRADPPILRYRGRVDSVAYLGGPQTALELDHEMGDLFVFAEHLRGRQRGVEVEEEMGVDLLFEMKGSAPQCGAGTLRGVHQQGCRPCLERRRAGAGQRCCRAASLSFPITRIRSIRRRRFRWQSLPGPLVRPRWSYTIY